MNQAAIGSRSGYRRPTDEKKTPSYLNSSHADKSNYSIGSSSMMSQSMKAKQTTSKYPDDLVYANQDGSYG
jgi:hypothetical protein